MMDGANAGGQTVTQTNAVVLLGFHTNPPLEPPDDPWAMQICLLRLNHTPFPDLQIRTLFCTGCNGGNV